MCIQKFLKLSLHSCLEVLLMMQIFTISHENSVSLIRAPKLQKKIKSRNIHLVFYTFRVCNENLIFFLGYK